MDPSDFDENVLLDDRGGGYHSNQDGADGRTIYVLNAVLAAGVTLWALLEITFLCLAWIKELDDSRR